MPDFALLHRSAGSLFEGPRFDKALGVVFADARLGGVYSLGPMPYLRTVVEHRRGIGGLVLHGDGGLVVTGRNVAYKALGDTSTTSVLLDARALPQTSGFNDLTVDGRGRVYVGSVATGALDSDFSDPPAPPSLLVLIDLDGTARVLDDDIRLANGMAFSPDGRVLYVCDSWRRAVLSFDVNPDSGDVAGRRLLVQADTGVPDGMAVAADGSIWVALAHVGLVARYTPEGEPIGAWHTPDEFVTSLCFGGPDGRQVYITTGASSPDMVAGVYAATADIAGAEVPRAQVATHCPGLAAGVQSRSTVRPRRP